MVTYVRRSDLPELWADLNHNPSVWVPVLADPSRHYVDNSLSFIYIYSTTTFREYLVGFGHGDLDVLEPEEFFAMLSSGPDRYVYKRKWATPHLAGTVDMEMAYWFQHNEPLPVQDIDDTGLAPYYGWYRGMPAVNNSIPIVNFLEYCRCVKQIFIVSLPTFSASPAFRHYNGVILTNFERLERTGLCTAPNGAILHTEYNPYTLTGRPSNAFGGVNYAALNKTDGARRAYISRFLGGRLVEYDYQAFHLYLLGKLAGYTFTEGNPHEHLGRQYFRKDAPLTEDEYAKSKQLTFRLLYGEIPEGIRREVPFLAKVHNLSDRYWATFLRQDWVETPLLKRKMLKSNLKDINQIKLFNYLIQATETEYNSLVLARLLDYLYTKQSKLVLYTYDSFLFDYSPEDGDGFFTDISAILTTSGMSVSRKEGTNYHEMVRPGEIDEAAPVVHLYA
jgi:hypothetical protein